MIVTVEEAHCLLGTSTGQPASVMLHGRFHHPCPLGYLSKLTPCHWIFTATSYIYRDHFDEWSYSPDHSRPENSQPAQQTPERDPGSTTFEVPLTTLIECLGVFGTANMSSHSSAPKPKKWRREEEASDEERGDAKGKGRSAPFYNRQQANVAHGLEHFFGGGNEKKTSMRLSYAGLGYPLTLLL